MRRASTTAGLLILALLPVAAAVSPDTRAQTVPVAVAQPLTAFGGGLLLTPPSATLPESGLLIAVGGGLMALAAVMRRTGRAS